MRQLQTFKSSKSHLREKNILEQKPKIGQENFSNKNGTRLLRSGAINNDSLQNKYARINIDLGRAFAYN